MEAAVVQHGRLGDIAEVQDLLHAVVHELPVDSVRAVVVGIVAVV